MAIYLSNRDGGKTDEQGHYKFQTNAFTGNVLNGGLQVTQNSPLAMNVKVSGGDARIPYSDYAYTAWIPAGSPETVTVTTANPSNPRIDRLVMYVDRGETPSSATANNPTLCKLMLVAGTPAGSPSRPSNGTVDTAVSNNPYIDLADIRVNAGVTQITNANITDTRVLVGAPIADGSVTNTKLSTSAILLGYAERTSDFSSSATPAVTDITGLSVTVTVPSGGRAVKITAYSRYITGSGIHTLEIREGSTTLQSGVAVGGAPVYFANVVSVHTPTAGSHTYKVSFSQSSAGTYTFRAGAAYPAFILVELV